MAEKMIAVIERRNTLFIGISPLTRVVNERWFSQPAVVQSSGIVLHENYTEKFRVLGISKTPML
jgi:hypothetical protein